MRASDQDRERVVAALQQQLLTGRLDVDALDARVAAAYRSETREELDALVRDLPSALSAPHASGRGGGVPGGRLPGRRPFRLTFDAAPEPTTVLDSAMTTLGPSLMAAGFALTGRTATSVVFQAARSSVVVTAARARAGGTTVTVAGHAPLRLRRALAALGD